MFIHVANEDVFLSDTAFCCRFYITLNGMDFPSSDWEDMTSSVLEMWGDQLLGNIPNERSAMKLYFMDGPYYLNCKRYDNLIDVQGIDSHNAVKKKIICAQTFECKEFIKNVSICISRTLYIAQQGRYLIPNEKRLQTIRNALDGYWKEKN